MKQVKGRLFIGTSGWVYLHWEGIFYPNDLSGKDKLRYFSQHFKTTEINYSFYHLPRPTTYQNWFKQTPKDFLFAVKASRFITHIKRLKNIEDAWSQFLENALNLREKLGPILLQMPPSFKCNTESLQRIEDFLNLATKFNPPPNFGGGRLAIEIRNSSFENLKFFNLLKKYNVALVISNSPTWKEIEKPELADFVYVRLHGSKILFSSKYTGEELKDFAEKIKNWLKQNLDVYVYFNNDAMGYAIENARTLISSF